MKEREFELKVKEVEHEKVIMEIKLQLNENGDIKTNLVTTGYISGPK